MLRLLGESGKDDDDLYNAEELELILPARIRKRQLRRNVKGLLAY